MGIDFKFLMFFFDLINKTKWSLVQNRRYKRHEEKDIPLESHAKCFMSLSVPLILIHYDIAMNIDLTEHIWARWMENKRHSSNWTLRYTWMGYAHESLTYRVLSAVKVRLNYLQLALIRS